MPHTNGYIKLPVFVTVISLIVAAVAGSYGFALNRSESVRVEIKQDLDKMETRIVREIRATRGGR